MSAPVDNWSMERDTLSAAAAVALLRASSGEHLTETGELEALIGPERLSPARTAELVSAVRHLQAMQTRLQRRTQELSALLSTARELVQLHDVDTVLSRLVQRAHDIIGTDVTYLSEIEPENGGMRVRHSMGTISEEFRDLLVPAGKGLASKVVEARAPVWVSWYVDMDEAPRDPGIDAAVEAEGLAAFLGVPMVVGDEILGALFACNRFSHDFTPDQISLLSAFADHAAVALNSARMLRSTERAAQRAEDAYRELAAHVSHMEKASEVHETLTSAVVAGGSID